MTTHYQKIQALGNRMAENLTIMGVPSQFDEGGLTLADKILEISSRVTSGIILYADKKIAQSGDTANLYALVLDDNIAVSGEIVRFNGDVPLRSKVLTNTTDNVVGDDYYIHSTQPTTNWDFIGDLSINSEKIKIISETFVISEYTYVGMPHIKDGVLTFEDTLGETHTIDVSYTDTTSILTGSYTCTVYYPWVEITTDDDGVATYAYTCTGSGLREFYATSGTFVSEICDVWDTILHDEMSSDTTSNYFYPSSQPVLEFDTDHFVFNVTTNNQYFQMGTTSSGITTDLSRFKGKKLKLQVDVETTASVRVSILEYGASSFTQQANGDERNTDGTITVELPNAISDSCTRLYLRVVHTGWSSATINVRNLKLYQV